MGEPFESREEIEPIGGTALLFHLCEKTEPRVQVILDLPRAFGVRAPKRFDARTIRGNRRLDPRF
jgi:hypothetical protein